MDRFRLMTFNIAHGRGLSLYQGFQSARRIRSNLRRIARILADSRADLVALQEVDQDSHWNRHIDLADTLRRDNAYAHQYIGLHSQRPGRKRLSYGNAVLSHVPLKDRYNQPFSRARIGGKGFQFTEADLGGARLPVINVHLDFLTRRERLSQIEQIVRFLERRRARDTKADNPIVCGDFNCSATRARDAVQSLFRYLDDLEPYRLLPSKDRTFPAHLPTRALDHVLLPKRHVVRDVEVLPVYASDHRPVLVDLEPRLAA